MPFLGFPPDHPPRAILFDIGRVIIGVDLSRSMSSLGQTRNLSHSEVLRELEADPRWADWQEGRMNAREWHSYLAEKLRFDYGFDEFCAIWNSVLEPETLLPDSFFERIAANCRLGLLSNTDPIHVAYFEAHHSFVRYFPVRVYSCRAGVSKPSPAIFQHALRELSVAPGEALFVDDLLENVEAAARVGLGGFHFTSPEDLLDAFRRLVATR